MRPNTKSGLLLLVAAALFLVPSLYFSALIIRNNLDSVSDNIFGILVVDRSPLFIFILPFWLIGWGLFITSIVRLSSDEDSDKQ